MLKVTLALISMLATVSAFGEEDYDAQLESLKLECSGRANYIPVSLKVTREFTSAATYIGSHVSGADLVFSWSESECEDSTSLTFDKSTFDDFLAGKADSVWGTFEQEEPDFSLKMGMTCKFVSN